MNETEAINAMLTGAGMTKRAIARALGKSDSYVTAIQRQAASTNGGVSTRTLARIADACGYALALVPHDAIPEGSIEVDVR